MWFQRFEPKVDESFLFVGHTWKDLGLTADYAQGTYEVTGMRNRTTVNKASNLPSLPFSLFTSLSFSLSTQLNEHFSIF